MSSDQSNSKTNLSNRTDKDGIAQNVNHIDVSNSQSEGSDPNAAGSQEALSMDEVAEIAVHGENLQLDPLDTPKTE